MTYFCVFFLAKRNNQITHCKPSFYRLDQLFKIIVKGGNIISQHFPIIFILISSVCEQHFLVQLDFFNISDMKKGSQN